MAQPMIGHLPISPAASMLTTSKPVVAGDHRGRGCVEHAHQDRTFVTCTFRDFRNTVKPRMFTRVIRCQVHRRTPQCSPPLPSLP